VTDEIKIDAGHHLLYPDRFEYSEVAGEDAAQPSRFAAEDVKPLLDESGMTYSVVENATWSVAETVALLEEAEYAGFVLGVVGCINLTSQETPAVVHMLSRTTGGDRLVAVQHRTDLERDTEWLVRDDVMAGIRSLAASGLALEVSLRRDQVATAVEMARALPECRVVITGVAAKDVTARDALADWSGAAAALAGAPNVHVKLPGLITRGRRAQWPRDALIAGLERALEWFGEDRVIFASGWPLHAPSGSYPEVVETFEAALSGFSHGVRAKVFGSNARQLYHLAVPGQRASR
jgi:L-fuconolactonase